MKIVLATPLYPPDIAEPAPYVKELAKRLTGPYAVTIVTYGRLPEPVPYAQIVAVDKRQPLAKRLVVYARALWRAAKGADIIYAQNGASVELPIALMGLFLRKPIVIHQGDVAAHQFAQKHFIYGLIERLAYARARKVVTDSPLPRPEILPLEPYPTEAFEAYEESWKKHVRILAESLHV
jgi:hypothetical protein